MVKENKQVLWIVFVILISLWFGLTIQVGNAAAESGLDFPGTAASTMRFKFDNPQDNGLPIYGLSGNGVTYIWRVYPRQKAGYYTTFFWGNDDGQGNICTFLWVDSCGAADSYYGAHPYPNPPPDGTAHDWEIAVDQDDFVNGVVVYDRWYTQALRVWADSLGYKHHKFYWDLPDTDASHMVTRTSDSSRGNTNPPSPALTWGDAPWNPGNEVYDGIIRGIRVYSVLLSVNDMLSEASSPLSTSAGASGIWYLNMDPTPTDISDKSGKGHDPAWVGSERPALYTGDGGEPASPTPTTQSGGGGGGGCLIATTAVGSHLSPHPLLLLAGVGGVVAAVVGWKDVRRRSKRQRIEGREQRQGQRAPRAQGMGPEVDRR